MLRILERKDRLYGAILAAIEEFGFLLFWNVFACDSLVSDFELLFSPEFKVLLAVLFWERDSFKWMGIGLSESSWEVWDPGSFVELCNALTGDSDLIVWDCWLGVVSSDLIDESCDWKNRI